jgi:luciferase family oxidoreductase group 1
MKFPLSVLDLAPVSDGQSASDAVRRTVDLARLADRLGYQRYWFAEHHGMGSVASSSPEVLIAYVAGATERIRVGSGGVMLPNHAPLRIAEAFHTLSALYPGRIDFGIGRAPGSEATASRALRAFNGEQFSGLMSELLFLSQARFSPGHPFHKLRVMPADAPLPPVWILGSSGASANACGASGFGYAFASHFSDEPAAPAIRAYRESFQPSADFAAPSAVLAIATVCAETAEEADRLATSMDLLWLKISRGEFPPLPSPEQAQAYDYSPSEQEQVRRTRARCVIGTPASVREQITQRMEASGATEAMLVTNVYDHDARLRSYALVAEAFAQAA